MTVYNRTAIPPSEGHFSERPESALSAGSPAGMADNVTTSVFGRVTTVQTTVQSPFISSSQKSFNTSSISSNLEEEEDVCSLPKVNSWSSFIVTTNQYLSLGAVIPGVGIITGTLKIALSIIHAIGATIALAFSLKNTNHLKYAFLNMGLGLLEAIPLIGSFVGFMQVATCWSCKLNGELNYLND